MSNRTSTSKRRTPNLSGLWEMTMSMPGAMAAAMAIPQATAGAVAVNRVMGDPMPSIFRTSALWTRKGYGGG